MYRSWQVGRLQGQLENATATSGAAQARAKLADVQSAQGVDAAELSRQLAVEKATRKADADRFRAQMESMNATTASALARAKQGVDVDVLAGLQDELAKERASRKEEADGLRSQLDAVNAQLERANVSSGAAAAEANSHPEHHKELSDGLTTLTCDCCLPLMPPSHTSAASATKCEPLVPTFSIWQLTS